MDNESHVKMTSLQWKIQEITSVALCILNESDYNSNKTDCKNDQVWNTVHMISMTEWMQDWQLSASQITMICLQITSDWMLKNKSSSNLKTQSSR